MITPTSITFRRVAGVAAFAAVALLLVLPTAGAAPGAKQAKLQYPIRTLLTNSIIGHWAVVVRNVGAHKLPSSNSYVVTTLKQVTEDGTQNVVLILNELDLDKSHVWYQVRLPILPNNSTGWVPKSALGTVNAVHTHLYVNRESQTLTLKRDGKTIFITRVGVGKTAPGWGPTPAGQFYIRDKLTNFHNAFYGPIAFGTSARSAVLTEWPGGGFVGVHGTNEPGLIPGYISHGCIRVRNPQILKLASLMSVGTPLTIT
jgi:lipoprotein-anchoring transpeptidase ErfK/SrfK